MWYWYLLCSAISVIVGVFIGVFSSIIAVTDKTFGTLRSKNSEDGPYLYLDLDKEPELMAHQKIVVFRVDMEDPTPQE